MGFVLIGIGVAVLIVLIWVIAIYNRLTKTRQHVRDSWAGIDVELKRRYDLIPNLVETVKGYAAHERDTLESLVELRNKAVASTGSAASQSVDEQKLALGLQRLFAVAEAYPNLKADSNYLALQKELAITEDRIAAARRFYNGNVRDMNTLCQSFPTNVIASWFGFEAVTFFELTNETERVVPRVAMA